MGPVGALFEPSGAPLGPSWDSLGPLWEGPPQYHTKSFWYDTVGGCFGGPLEVLLGPFWSLLGLGPPPGVLLGPLGPRVDVQPRFETVLASSVRPLARGALASSVRPQLARGALASSVRPHLERRLWPRVAGPISRGRLWPQVSGLILRVDCPQALQTDHWRDIV